MKMLFLGNQVFARAIKLRISVWNRMDWKLLLNPTCNFFIGKERHIWDIERRPVKMGAEIQCDVSESQGNPGLAGSEQKPREKPGVAFPSETLGGSNPTNTSTLLDWDRMNVLSHSVSVCNLLHQSRKTVSQLISGAMGVPSLPAAGSHRLSWGSNSKRGRGRKVVPLRTNSNSFGAPLALLREHNSGASSLTCRFARPHSAHGTATAPFCLQWGHLHWWEYPSYENRPCSQDPLYPGAPYLPSCLLKPLWSVWSKDSGRSPGPQSGRRNPVWYWSLCLLPVPDNLTQANQAPSGTPPPTSNSPRHWLPVSAYLESPWHHLFSKGAWELRSILRETIAGSHSRSKCRGQLLVEHPSTAAKEGLARCKSQWTRSSFQDSDF